MHYVQIKSFRAAWRAFWDPTRPEKFQMNTSVQPVLNMGDWSIFDGAPRGLWAAYQFSNAFDELEVTFCLTQPLPFNLRLESITVAALNATPNVPIVSAFISNVAPPAGATQTVITPSVTQSSEEGTAEFAALINENVAYTGSLQTDGGPKLDLSRWPRIWGPAGDGTSLWIRIDGITPSAINYRIGFTGLIMRQDVETDTILNPYIE